MSMGLVWRETLKELLSDSLELLGGRTHRWVTEKSFQLGNQIFAMAPFDPTLDPTPSPWVVGCYSQSPKMWAMPVQCCFAEIRNTSCTIGFL